MQMHTDTNPDAAAAAGRLRFMLKSCHEAAGLDWTGAHDAEVLAITNQLITAAKQTAQEECNV